MQTMHAVLEGKVLRLPLPPPETQLMQGVRWGLFDELLTPAYWKGQAWQHAHLGTYDNHRLGRSLVDELAACLLGGYGMPAELGLAAYHRVRNLGLLRRQPTVTEVERALAEPFLVPQGATRRYRFPRLKAHHLVGSLRAIQDLDPPKSDVALRDTLVRLPGIGPKTASWIVRNHRGSNEVAIIDIHVLRAGRHVGLFPLSWRPESHYLKLEAAFLDFARALSVRPSLLDAVIWDYMRRLGPPRQARTEVTHLDGSSRSPLPVTYERNAGSSNFSRQSNGVHHRPAENAQRAER